MKTPSRIAKPRTCKKCSSIFMAVRSDAVSCQECHKKRRKEHQKSDRGRSLRAKWHRETREKAYAGYGGVCACCGESRYEFLCIDHVNGGGREDRKIFSTWQIAKRVIDLGFPPEYQVLCHNCNSAKGFFGQCPHVTERERTA